MCVCKYVEGERRCMYINMQVYIQDIFSCVLYVHMKRN